jgi:hypothetical protein
MALRKKSNVESNRVFVSVEHLEYNTQREHILISEYGRNVQKMIQAAMKMEDREERNKAAQAIITAMAMLNPSVREVVDYKHKLWDHLFIISDFQLDVDCPYPIPEKSVVKAKPKQVTYPSGDIRYKYYGKNMENMIRHIGQLEDEKQKEQITQNLANFMKMSYLTWNKDTVDDSTIFKHLDELSNGQLRTDESMRLNQTSEILAANKDKQREINRKMRPNNNLNKNKQRRKK